MGNKFWILLIFLFGCTCCDTSFKKTRVNEYTPFETPDGSIQVSFSVTSDVQYYGGDYPNFFRHTCERIAIGGSGNFMISPGDMVPCEEVYHTIQRYLGADYTWYPVVGNHEVQDDPQNMTWLRNYNRHGTALPNVVRVGPPGGIETIYSFEWGNIHFVVLNEYFDGTSDTGVNGDISDGLHAWLMHDLTFNEKPVVFVLGHEPAYPQPDEESGRIRNLYGSLDKYPEHRDRFWNTLVSFGVQAYICGHSHNYSAVNFGGVWQIEAGHAKGTGDQGSKSTFIMFYVMEDGLIWFYTYRLNLEKNRFELSATQQIGP